MKRLRVLVLATITAAALSLPAISAHANPNGPNQNGNPQQFCQNGTVVNGQCIQGH